MEVNIGYDLKEFQKLKRGDHLRYKVGDKTLETVATSNPYYNADSDEPGWEIQTRDCTLSLENEILVTNETETNTLSHILSEIKGQLDKIEHAIPPQLLEKFENSKERCIADMFDSLATLKENMEWLYGNETPQVHHITLTITHDGPGHNFDEALNRLYPEFDIIDSGYKDNGVYSISGYWFGQKEEFMNSEKIRENMLIKDCHISVSIDDETSTDIDQEEELDNDLEL